MINVLLSHMLDEGVVEKEVHEARAKAKKTINKMVLNGVPNDVVDLSAWGNTEIGNPLGTQRTLQPGERRDLGPLPPETLPLEDAVNPFPMLDPPLG